MISRKAEKRITSEFFKGKVIHIPGARQVGKSTLLRHIIDNFDGESLWLNGDESDVRAMFEEFTSRKLSVIIGGARLLVIDEAQRIPNIGLCLKVIVDNIKEVQVVASGSSALELASELQEPLTGRKVECFLYPLSFSEMVDHHGYLSESRMLEHRLVFGYYPEVVTHEGREIDVLRRLSESYLYKDIFVHEGIKKPMLVDKLIQALAHQVGNEVSTNELGQLIGADHKTIERYIDLLEKAYVIFRLPSLSRNVRNEIKKGKKVYFFDNGLRNAIIRNFNQLEFRNDIGALWENFLVSERMKANNFHNRWVNSFFWRTHAQQEIDYLEEFGGQLSAYEFKWRERKLRPPRSFMESYEVSGFDQITRANYADFIL